MKYRLKLTSLALCNALVLLVVGLVFFISSFWIFGTVAGNNGIVHEAYYNNQKPMIIISGSMEPELKTNGLIIIESKPYDEVGVGDIIMFNTAKHGLVIHRIVEETVLGFITKGDNNEYRDDWIVTPDMYKGSVAAVYNEVSGFISLFFGDFTTIRKERVLLGFLGLSLILTYIIVILNFIYDYIFIPFFLRKGLKKGELEVFKEYYSWTTKRLQEEEILEGIKQIGKRRTFFKELVFRYQVMKWHNALKEEEKQVRKVAKRYNKVKGCFIDD